MRLCRAFCHPRGANVKPEIPSGAEVDSTTKGTKITEREPSEFESRKGISEMEDKAARAAASEWSRAAPRAGPTCSPRRIHPSADKIPVLHS